MLVKNDHEKFEVRVLCWKYLSDAFCKVDYDPIFQIGVGVLAQ